MLLRIVQRSWYPLGFLFLISGAFIAVGVSEGWIAVASMQELAKWVCLAVVTMGMSVICLIQGAPAGA